MEKIQTQKTLEHLSNKNIITTQRLDSKKKNYQDHEINSIDLVFIKNVYSQVKVYLFEKQSYKDLIINKSLPLQKIFP